jgi:hypothetical protein
VASGNAATDAVTVALRSLLLVRQSHPSQHLSYPHKRSDRFCDPSLHSYGIWLSDVPHGPHDLNAFWNYTVGPNKCAYLLATFHFYISFRGIMIDMQQQFKTD